MNLPGSFAVAFNGLFAALRSQRNLKIHFAASAVVAAAAFYFKLERWEWCTLLVCCAQVISTELMNTALEVLTDMVSPSYHELAGKTKDIAAAAVLAACIFSVVIAAIIFIPHFAG